MSTRRNIAFLQLGPIFSVIIFSRKSKKSKKSKKKKAKVSSDSDDSDSDSDSEDEEVKEDAWVEKVATAGIVAAGPSAQGTIPLLGNSMYNVLVV